MEYMIISVGKIKDKYLKDGISEYKKRLSKYAKVTEITLNDQSVPQNASDADIQAAIEKESSMITSKLKDSFVIALALEGHNLSSEELAQKIETIKTYHNSRITFLIGGSHGLSDAVKKQADFLWSFSNLTFPHMVIKMLLLEQLFRAEKINNNEPYHK